MNAVPHDDPELGTQPLPLQRPAVAAAAAAVSDEQRTLSQMQETLNAEFNRMGTSAKLYLPFFVLLLLKFLLGHVLTGVLVIAVLSSMTQIRNALNTQLSLKSQMNIKALSYMATCTALLIIAYATCMGNRLGYSEHLSQRLLFVYAVTESNDQSFWMVVWNCWLVDLFVQMALLLVKQLVCVGFASQHLQRPRGWCQACHGKLAHPPYILLLLLFAAYVLLLLLFSWREGVLGAGGEGGQQRILFLDPSATAAHRGSISC